VTQIKGSGMFLMIFDRATGLLDFDKMREYYQSDYRGIIAPYSGSSAPVKIIPKEQRKKLEINLDVNFFTNNRLVELLNEYKVSPHTFESGSFHEKLAHQQRKGGRGGSRTKKLNKINSRNKSKKINF
jgi:hypothetical protein